MPVTAQSNVGALLQLIGGSGNVFSGAGSPEGVQTADIGDVFQRTNGGPGNSLYLKVADSGGNTGWVPSGPLLEEDLSSQVDGVVTTFNMTGNAFQSVAFQILVEVRLNGVGMRQGATNDYTITESGGLGTGFDTVEFNYTPTSDDILIVRFLPL